jgi:integrase
MTGSLKKRSEKSWSIVLYLGRDPITGKKKQSWRTVHGTKKDAERELNRLLHELNTGAYLDPSKLTVGEYLDKWLSDYAKTNVSGKTYERYEGIVRDHLKPALGAHLLTKLQPLHVQAHYSAALKDGRKDGRDGGLSAQTVVHHHRVLREALHRAVRWGLVARNVADAVEPPRPEKVEIKAIDEAQTVWLIEASERTRLYIPILLAVTTGMRRGEILALRWQDVELNHGFLTVRRSLQQTKAGGLKFKQTKGRRPRPISIPQLLTDALAGHQVKQTAHKVALGAGYQDHDLVCCVEDGSIWKPSAFTSAYRDLLRRRKIRNIRFHDLRHSHASQLLRAGVNPKVISERLGHSKVAFTLDVYSHLLPGMQEEAATKTDAGLRAAVGRKPS